MTKTPRATDLRDLRDELIADDRLVASEGRETEIDWTDLPTFGGTEPRDTVGVWSWDATSLLVGTSADDLQIVTRDEGVTVNLYGEDGVAVYVDQYGDWSVDRDELHAASAVRVIGHAVYACSVEDAERAIASEYQRLRKD